MAVRAWRIPGETGCSRCRRGGELWNGVTLSCLVPRSEVFPLEIGLRDLDISQRHADVAMTEQLHQRLGLGVEQRILDRPHRSATTPPAAGRVAQ